MMGATGAGVHKWGTEEEEDLWTVAVVTADPDRQGAEGEDGSDNDDDDDYITVGELAEWRYMCSEREKERVRCSRLLKLTQVLTQTEGKHRVQERGVRARYQTL